MRQRITTILLMTLIAFGHQVNAKEILPFAGEWVGKNKDGNEMRVVFSGNTLTSYRKQEPVLIAGELHQIKPYIKKSENVTFFQALDKKKNKQFVMYIPDGSELFRFELTSTGQLVIYDDGKKGKPLMTLSKK